MNTKHLTLTPVLMAAQDGAAAAATPDWVHLLPGGSEIRTGDARGPYHVTGPTALIAASFAEADRLPIDENHATDLAAPLGQPSPARGWIVEMQARADGIWGRVEWTEAGRALVADRAYRAISPVVLHDTSRLITRILRASLVNRPNLRGLAALNQESDVKPLLERLAEMLGLDATAGEDAVIGAVKALMDKKPDPALQSQLAEIGQVFGVTGDGAAVLAAARRTAKEGAALIPALQSQVTELTGQLKTITDGQMLTRAEAFIDGEIKNRRMGLNQTNRDEFVALHMENPERTEKLVKGFATVNSSGMTAPPPVATDGTVALNAEQTSAAKVLGLDPKTYAATLKAERAHEEAL